MRWAQRLQRKPVAQRVSYLKRRRGESCGKSARFWPLIRLKQYDDQTDASGFGPSTINVIIRTGRVWWKRSVALINQQRRDHNS